LGILKSLSNRQTKTRNTTYSGEVEYTEVTYDIELIKSYYKGTNDRVSQLQMAIDRCNLNPVIEVNEEALKY
jgi:hypothetical protein